MHRVADAEVWGGVFTLTSHTNTAHVQKTSPNVFRSSNTKFIMVRRLVRQPQTAATCCPQISSTKFPKTLTSRQCRIENIIFFYVSSHHMLTGRKAVEAVVIIQTKAAIYVSHHS